MKNTVVFPEVNSGDILVWNDSFKGRSNYGSLIRLFTASDFTHVGIAIRNGRDIYSAEANIPKIHVVPVKLSDRLYYIPTPVTHNEDGQNFINRTQGLKYSYLDAVRSLFGIVDASDDRYQCAEYVVDYMKIYGHDLGKAYTPSRLVRAAMRHFDAPLVPLYN